jgi:Nucleotidyl transferase AbiEii toxin, Type IV TA system
MDAFHQRLARVALARGATYGFALAGGYAVQAHGFLDRPSEDVDLFTTMDAEGDFPAAVAAITNAFQDDGLHVEAPVNAPGFARLLVSDPLSGDSAQVELGIDWRAHPPTVLKLGPVLHPDDAVANKVTALFSRAQARDYIDVHAALTSGRYDGEALLRLAVEHDPGFDRQLFAQALMSIRRLPASEFTAYGLSGDDVSGLIALLTRWAAEISDS